MAKKIKRYAAGDEIVVSGQRRTQPDAASVAMLDRMMREPIGGMGDSMGGGGGGGMRSIRPTPLPAPARSTGPRITPAVINQPRSTLGRLTGTDAPRGYGAKLSTSFKKGGKAKKMAKGGSASRRADGCATQGKTKGKFV